MKFKGPDPVFRKIIPLLTLGLNLVLQGVAWASSESHGADSGVLQRDFLYRCLNFLVMGGILYYFLAKPVRERLAERRTQLQETLQEARRAQQVAEARIQDFEAKLAESDRELGEMWERAQEANRREREATLAEALAISEKVRKEAREMAELEIDRAKRELRGEAARMALAIAEQQLLEKLTPEDKSRLIQENLQRMESQQ